MKEDFKMNTMGIKKRNIFLALLFSVITCGIYWIYWFVKITNDSNQLAPKHATMGGVKAFFVDIFTCGIYGIYWVYRLGQKEGEIVGSGSSGFLYLMMYFLTLSVVPMCMAQSCINKAVA